MVMGSSVFHLRLEEAGHRNHKPLCTVGIAAHNHIRYAHLYNWCVDDILPCTAQYSALTS